MFEKHSKRMKGFGEKLRNRPRHLSLAHVGHCSGCSSVVSYEALFISENHVHNWSGRPRFRSGRPPLWPITACHSKCYSFRTPVNQTYSFRTPVNQTYSFRTPVNQTGLRDSPTGNTRKSLNTRVMFRVFLLAVFSNLLWEKCCNLWKGIL